MSTDSDKEPTSCCANCGKSEEEADKLNKCAACQLVKYCGRDCQITHRPRHKKECRKRAAELYEEELFKMPPKPDDCPICFLMLPSTIEGQTFMVCCGKSICSGCCLAHDLQSNRSLFTCPFCRTSAPSSAKHYTKMLEKRVNTDNPMAIYQLGTMYLNGDEEYSVKKDMDKAIKLLHRAAKIGSAPAYCNLSLLYEKGDGVSKDEAKARQYFEKGAIAGDVSARTNLGCDDANAGNFDRAIKHWLIAASFGDIRAVNNIKRLFVDGYATKDHYGKALRQYQAYLDEVKSEQRDKAAAHKDEFKYLIEDTR